MTVLAALLIVLAALMVAISGRWARSLENFVYRLGHSPKFENMRARMLRRNALLPAAAGVITAFAGAMLGRDSYVTWLGGGLTLVYGLATLWRITESSIRIELGGTVIELDLGRA